MHKASDEVDALRDAIFDAVSDALAQVPGAYRPFAALWTLEEAARQISWTHGSAHAAMACYAIGDVLATGGRV